MCIAFPAYIQCIMTCTLEGLSTPCCLVWKDLGRISLQYLIDLGGSLVDLLALGLETMVGVEDSQGVTLYVGETSKGVKLLGRDVPPPLPLN